MNINQFNILNECNPQFIENLLNDLKLPDDQLNDISKYKLDFPFYEWFEESNGKNFGDKFESWMKSFLFTDLKERLSTGHDAIYQNQRIEIKVSRAIKSPQGDGTHIKSRAVKYDKNNPFKNVNNFLQVKPSSFDYMIAVILYKDAMALYVIKSNDISTYTGKENKEIDKLLLSKQHRNHKTEGQLNPCKQLNPFLYKVYDNLNVKLNFKDLI